MSAFWAIAPFVVLAALGLVFARKAVHAALCLAVVMIGLAVLYAAQDAPFLFAVQIIVYTGAIMMLFLFVLMLVGVETTDSLRETIAGHQLATALVGLGFAVTVVVAIGQTALGPVTGLDGANEFGNVYGLAALMFSPYVVAFQFTAALLITAVLGAMVLAHREALEPRRTQADISRDRMAEYAASGLHPGNPPTPGVFARHNAVDTAALLPDGSPVDGSVSPSIVARGQLRDGFDDDIDDVRRQLAGEEAGDRTTPPHGGSGKGAAAHPGEVDTSTESTTEAYGDPATGRQRDPRRPDHESAADEPETGEWGLFGKGDRS